MVFFWALVDQYMKPTFQKVQVILSCAKIQRPLISVGSYPDMTLGKKRKHKNNDLTKQKKEQKDIVK